LFLNKKKQKETKRNKKKQKETKRNKKKQKETKRNKKGQVFDLLGKDCYNA